MAHKPVELLKVTAWGKTVGAVAPARNRRGFAFQYDSDWAKTGIELSPILMPLSDARRVFVFDQLPSATFSGLPPMLADVLPDNFGNSVINAALAREGLRPGDVTALDRLAYTGSRGMGVLNFEPDNTPAGLPTAVELDELIVAARSAVLGDLGCQDTRAEALNNLLAVGTSAGGARAKAIVAWNPETNELRAGGIPTPAGFEQWLLKFDGVGEDSQLGETQQYGRIEAAYAQLAKTCGIEMSETKLLTESGRAHFMTRRFDRPGVAGQRLHMQSLCGIAGLDYKLTTTHDYASYFSVLRELNLANSAGLDQAFRRLVFNIVASNNDDHTKNFSFLMQEDGHWELAPAYDLTFAYNPTSKWISKHLMSVEGEFENITLGLLEQFGDRHGVPAYRTIIQEVLDAVSKLDSYLLATGVSEDGVKQITKRVSEIWRNMGV